MTTEPEQTEDREPDPTAPPEKPDEADPAPAPPKAWEPLAAPKLVRVADLGEHPKSIDVPEMPPAQWERFLAHVAEHGVREPILITPDNKVLDGRTRRKGALKSNQEFVPSITVDWDEQRQERYLLEAALLRRHLTDDQQAMIEVRLAKLEAPEMRRARGQKGGKTGGRGRPKNRDSLSNGASAELSAEASGPAKEGGGRGTATPPKGPSERKRRGAREVDKASPEMGDRVIAGEVSLHDAKRELRGEGKLPPVKPLEVANKAESTHATRPMSATATDKDVPGADFPYASATALAEATLVALGAQGAVDLLREALALVVKRAAGEEAESATRKASASNDGSHLESSDEEPVDEEEDAGPEEDIEGSAAE